MLSRPLLYLLALGLSSSIFFMQEKQRPCCTVIDIDKDSGVVVMRSYPDGWIKLFKPDALKFAEINIGDSVDASLVVNQVSRIKGEASSYPLLQPEYSDPCCEISSIVAGKAGTIVTARTSGQDSLRFAMPDTLATRFVAGNKVYLSPTHGFAMVYAMAGSDSAQLLYGFPILPK